MEIIGIPGSLENILKPVREIAERRQLFPHNFEQLQRQGDIGHYLAKIKQIYQQELAKKPYNRLLEPGIKAEYYLASELKMKLHEMDGYLFNNPSIDIRDNQVKGVGLSSFPDHLLITRNRFLYLETKNWSKEYLAVNGEKKKAEINQQVELTQKHLARFLMERGIEARPTAVVYDHQGTLGESIGRLRVAHRVTEIAQMVISSPSAVVDDIAGVFDEENVKDSIREYQSIVDVFRRLYK
ncbi:MAG: nuclease-related domain-containing protein [Nanoarchaeota archaeon]|nr:nuclease-related domain-containing protein [Nanoarchaeota archaeon]